MSAQGPGWQVRRKKGAIAGAFLHIGKYPPRPLLWVSRIPGLAKLLQNAYRWLAAQRNCAAVECAAAGVPRR